jgi:hypothetical protein
MMFVIALVVLFGKAEASFMMVELGIPNLRDGNLAFGDFDNDGDLDLMTLGSHTYQGMNSTQARLYRNIGNWQFIDTGFEFGDFVQGGVSWADFNNDGWLDVVLSGAESISGYSKPIKLFQNDAGQGFIAVDFTFHNTSNSNHIWADVDNDFDMDLIIIGRVSNVFMFGDLCMYYNLGNGEFQYDSLAALPNFLGSETGYLSAVDFNRDGYLDLTIGAIRVYGGTGSSRTIAWRRTSTGTYESVFGNEIGGGGGFQWFDYDCDGTLDFLYTGYQANIGDATILLLNENGLFTNTTHSFPATEDGDLATADYDNDGDADIFITGGTFLSALANLYRNDGSGIFTEAGQGLQPVYRSYAFWVDIDNDNDLDLAYTGYDGYGWTMFYRNENVVQNQPPSAPVLSYDQVNGFVISGATDSVTPQHSLTYDLKIGTSPGAADVYHPMADLETGFRKVPGPGRPSFREHRLTAGGIYYASAQAIDGGFMGSIWGPEIVIDLSVALDDQIQNIPSPAMYPNPFSDQINIRLAALPSNNIKAEIYNIRGQKIRCLKAQNASGVTNYTWDGMDESGLRVSNGVYYLRLAHNKHINTSKILLIK